MSINLDCGCDLKLPLSREAFLQMASLRRMDVLTEKHGNDDRIPRWAARDAVALWDALQAGMK